jgi:hypothetical protein
MEYRWGHINRRIMNRKQRNSDTIRWQPERLVNIVGENVGSKKCPSRN